MYDRASPKILGRQVGTLLIQKLNTRWWRMGTVALLVLTSITVLAVGGSHFFRGTKSASAAYMATPE